MSGESATHVKLVELLIATIEQAYVRTPNFVVLADHHRFGSDRPPQLGGFTPDVYGFDIARTVHVVGEAKTAVDFYTDRTDAQLAAFLEHLRWQPSGALYLAVPWGLAAAARNRIRLLVAATGRLIQTHVIGSI